jgi:hypothetical protein
MKRALPLLTLFCLLIVPAIAQAGATGTYSLTSPTTGVYPARQAAWQMSGALLPARAEAPLVGVPLSAQITNTDSRYVTAQLQSASIAPVVNNCGDGMGGTTTVQTSGVASAISTFETNLVLDYLHGRGHAEVSVAESPYTGATGAYYFAPGQSNYMVHSTCYDQVTDTSDTIPAVGGFSSVVFTDNESQNTKRINWPLRHAANGAWVMGGSRTITDDVQPVTVQANVAFTGSGVALHARCTMPTARDLAGARTLTQARRIMARAGYPASIATARRTRAVRRGHYFVLEGVGNTNPIACGYRRLHLVRSLGWD